LRAAWAFESYFTAGQWVSGNHVARILMGARESVFTFGFFEIVISTVFAYFHTGFLLVSVGTPT